MSVCLSFSFFGVSNFYFHSFFPISFSLKHFPYISDASRFIDRPGVVAVELAVHKADPLVRDHLLNTREQVNDSFSRTFKLVGNGGNNATGTIKKRFPSFRLTLIKSLDPDMELTIRILVS